MQQKMSMTLCGSAFGWEKKLAQRDLPSEDDMFVYMSHRMVRNMTRHGIMQGYACVKSLFRVLVVIRGGGKGDAQQTTPRDEKATSTTKTVWWDHDDKRISGCSVDMTFYSALYSVYILHTPLHCVGLDLIQPDTIAALTSQSSY